MYDDKSLLDRFVELLIDGGCTINKPAVAEVAKLALSRERALVDSFKREQERDYEQAYRHIDNELTKAGKEWNKL